MCEVGMHYKQSVDHLLISNGVFRGSFPNDMTGFERTNLIAAGPVKRLYCFIQP